MTTRPIVLLTLMLICLPVLGQEQKGVWSGSATINGGTNFDKKGENLADYEPNTKFSPLVNFRTIWRPSESHKLTLNLNNTIQRPDYLNLCWFQRPGSYINELNEGSPNLRPAQTSRAALEYTFTKNRFSTSLEIGDSYVTNKIERTFRMEKIEDHDIRVYTWINGGFSNTANAKLNVRWSGRKLKTGASGNINYFIGINTSDKVTRNSDYRIEADASYNWFWDITYLARFRYQSKIIRSYSSITEYFGLDFRITKPFLKKKFELFAEGRDLLDKPITTETYSEDGMEGRYETLTTTGACSSWASNTLSDTKTT